MGREEEGGFRMGNTCIPVADSCDIWQNQYNIVKFKNKIKKKKIPEVVVKIQVSWNTIFKVLKEVATAAAAKSL